MSNDNIKVDECVIYRLDENGQYILEDSFVFYTNRDCEYSENELRECIDEFLATLD